MSAEARHLLRCRSWVESRRAGETRTQADDWAERQLRLAAAALIGWFA